LKKGIPMVLGAVFGTVLCAIVFAQDGQTIGLKGLKLPLEYYPDGTLKALLKAEVSTVDSSGQSIKGENLRYETYLQSGATDVVVVAENCLYDKAKGLAESESKVRLEKKNVVITGKGFTMDSKKEMISLHSDVVVEFDQGLMAKEKKE